MFGGGSAAARRAPRPRRGKSGQPHPGHADELPAVECGAISHRLTSGVGSDYQTPGFSITLLQSPRWFACRSQFRHLQEAVSIIRPDP